VAEHLPSKFKARSSNLSTTKKKNLNNFIILVEAQNSTIGDFSHKYRPLSPSHQRKDACLLQANE
jgi:hypothetical protein